MKSKICFKSFKYWAIFALIFCGIQTSEVLGQAVMNNDRDTSRVEASPQYPNAVKIFTTAAALVMGGETPDYEIKDSVIAFARTSRYSEKFNEGIKLNDAINWFKDKLSYPSSEIRRKLVINNAFQEVYGRDSMPNELSAWDTEVMAQKATYASIVLAEKGKLNKNSVERKATIDRAYQKSMGRNAAAEDLQYWQPRPEHFRQIVEAARTYLYSPSGAKDLKETVTRAYQTKYKGSPLVDSRIAKLTTDFTTTKSIYVEMIK